MNKIWILFSIENEYNQPDNNFVAWWKNKPSLEHLFAALDIKPNESSDEFIVAAAKIWSGTSELIGSTVYRLEEVIEGEIK